MISRYTKPIRYTNQRNIYIPMYFFTYLHSYSCIVHEFLYPSSKKVSSWIVLLIMNISPTFLKLSTLLPYRTDTCELVNARSSYFSNEFSNQSNYIIYFNFQEKKTKHSNMCQQVMNMFNLHEPYIPIGDE